MYFVHATHVTNASFDHDMAFDMLPVASCLCKANCNIAGKTSHRQFCLVAGMVWLQTVAVSTFF